MWCSRTWATSSNLNLDLCIHFNWKSNGMNSHRALHRKAKIYCDRNSFICRDCICIAFRFRCERFFWPCSRCEHDAHSWRAVCVSCVLKIARMAALGFGGLLIPNGLFSASPKTIQSFSHDFETLHVTTILVWMMLHYYLMELSLHDSLNTGKNIGPDFDGINHKWNQNGFRIFF